MRFSRLSVLAFLGLIVALGMDASRGAAGKTVPNGDWTGSYALPAGSALVAIDLQIHANTVMVALGPGHTQLLTASLHRRGSSLQFALPGDPSPVRFGLQLRRKILSGLVSQGTFRGKARLTQGKPSLARFLGTYRTAGGDLFILNDLRRRGAPPWFMDVGIDGLRGLYRLSSSKYAIGSGTAIRDPVAGTLAFAPDGSALTEVVPGQPDVHATRLHFPQQEIRFRSGKTMLAGTLTLPEGSGPFPAVIMVHGSGPSLRDEGQTFMNFLAAHGIASLTPDKRGQGESGGIYPGEFPSSEAVSTYAQDAIAGGRFLARQQLIDPKRVGLFGGSQAGWIIPLAAARASSLFRYAVVLSGPVVSVGESDFYASLTTQGDSSPDMSPEQIDAAVMAAGPSGFDPRPFIRKVRIPMFWVYGGLDQNQPTRLDIPVLQELKTATRADFSWVVFPAANHGLVTTKTGLNSEAAQSPGFAPGLFASIAGWFVARSLGD